METLIFQLEPGENQDMLSQPQWVQYGATTRELESTGEAGNPVFCRVSGTNFRDAGYPSPAALAMNWSW